MVPHTCPLAQLVGSMQQPWLAPLGHGSAVASCPSAAPPPRLPAGGHGTASISPNASSPAAESRSHDSRVTGAVSLRRVQLRQPASGASERQNSSGDVNLPVHIIQD